MSPLTTVDVEPLIAPAASGVAAGPDLRYQQVYDEIKAARRLADADPRDPGLWKKVLEMVTPALRRSKDLQLAVWMLEALTKLDGFHGAANGLAVVRRLLAERWDALYPALDPDDADPAAYRLSLISWLNDRLPGLIKAAPLTAPPSSYSLLHYEVTQKTGEEKRAMLEEGWPSLEQFDKALQSSPVTHLSFVLECVAKCDAEVAALEAIADERFTAPGGRSEGVSFSQLKRVLSTSRWLLERPLNAGAARAGGSGAGTTSDVASQGMSTNGDAVWSEAVNFTRDSRLDGLRLLQAQVAAANGGRDRFLKQLQFAELCVQAGVHALAFPIYDELARIIEGRDLETWEDRALITRVWLGLRQCCTLLESHMPAAATRGREIEDKINGAAQAEPPSES